MAELQTRRQTTLDPWVSGEESIFPQDAQGRYLNDDGSVMTHGQQLVQAIGIIVAMAVFYGALISAFGKW